MEVGFNKDKKEEEKKSRFINIEMASQDTPIFKPIKKGDSGWISYGEKNDYDVYLIDIYNRCAEHKTAINKKCSYVFGKGLTYTKTGDVKTDAKIEKFLAQANPKQSWNQLLPKPIKSVVISNGTYYQFIFGLNGKIVSTYALPFSRIRLSICETFYWYCEDWQDEKKVKAKVRFEKYNETLRTGTCIYYHKKDEITATKLADSYAMPSYSGALRAIETEINIDVFQNTLSENGMTAQGMLTLFNGEPLEGEEKVLKKLFDKNYTGPKKAGQFILNFANPEGKAAEVTNFAVSDLDKTFENVGKKNIQKICVAHEIDPVLIGIDTATSWSRPQLLDKWEKMQNEYTLYEQEFHLEVPRLVANHNGVPFEPVHFEQLPPLNEELDLGEGTFNEVLTIEEKRNYLRDRKGVTLSSFDDESTTSRLSIAQKLGVGGTASLQALIIDTTIPDKNQKLNIMVGLYGVPEKKAKKMLGIVDVVQVDEKGNPIAMSAVRDEILEAFKLKAIDSNDDEVLETKFISGDPAEFEASQEFKFAEILGATVKEVRNQILDLLAGDPFIKPELIAKQLGTDVDYVNEQITQLKESGILEASGKGFNITEKGLNRADNVEPVIETEIYTVYQYALSPGSDYKNSKGYKDTSHEFCIEMMKLSNSGKIFNREDIDSISNEFSENAWIYRGGFTGRKNGSVTPYCNHVWKAVTKTRKRGSNG